VRRAGAIAVAITVTAAPGLAVACPMCALRGGPGAAVLALVAGMIAVPYVIAVVAIRVARKIETSERRDP